MYYHLKENLNSEDLIFPKLYTLKCHNGFYKYPSNGCQALTSFDNGRKHTFGTLISLPQEEFGLVDVICTKMTSQSLI